MLHHHVNYRGILSDLKGTFEFFFFREEVYLRPLLSPMTFEVIHHGGDIEGTVDATESNLSNCV